MSRSDGNSTHSGFLTLADIIDYVEENTKEPPIFDIPKSSNEANNEQTMRKKFEAYFEYDKEKNNPIAIDLKLGDEVFLSTKELPFKLGGIDYPNDHISIKPGEFALLTTYEKLHLPEDIFALISMRFSFKLKGLINVSGFHVDPGYEGKIIYSVYNAGPTPIILKKGERVFTIIIARINTRAKRKGERNFNKIEFIQEKHIAGLVGTPISLQGIHDRVRTLEMWNKIMIGVMSGLVIAVLGALIGKGGF